MNVGDSILSHLGKEDGLELRDLYKAISKNVRGKDLSSNEGGRLKFHFFKRVISRLKREEKIYTTHSTLRGYTDNFVYLARNGEKHEFWHHGYKKHNKPDDIRDWTADDYFVG